MNAPSLDEMRAAAHRDATDYKMEQVRELLVGDAVRRVEARVTVLETRLSEVELGISRQLDALEARIEALAQSADGEQRSAFESLAQSLADLGEQVRNIARR
jgi:DNA anti-recombination protein RmuC